MAARYIDKVGSASVAATTNDIKNAPDAAGIAYDRSDGTVKYNNAGTLQTLLSNVAPVASLTAAGTVTAAQSGSTFFLNLAAGFATTLPAPTAGLRYRFVVGTAPMDGDYTIVTAGGDNVIFGAVISVPVDDAGLLASAEDTITLVEDVAIAGDWVELVADGTNWYVDGVINVIEALTFTA